MASEIRHRRRAAAVFVNNQHDTKRRGQDFAKKFVFERVHSEEVDTNFLRKGWTKRGVNKLFKKCGTQAQSQAARQW